MSRVPPMSSLHASFATFRRVGPRVQRRALERVNHTKPGTDAHADAMRWLAIVEYKIRLLEKLRRPRRPLGCVESDGACAVSGSTLPSGPVSEHPRRTATGPLPQPTDEGV